MRFKVIALALVLQLPTIVVAQDCIEYGDYLHWVGEVDTPGSAIGVAISSTHAYVVVLSLFRRWRDDRRCAFLTAPFDCFGHCGHRSRLDAPSGPFRTVWASEHCC